MTGASHTALIGLDWGTSSLRAFRMGPLGDVQEQRHSDQGILNVTDGDFAAALGSLVEDWRRREAAAPLLACGMIGSRQGWREVPYVTAPAGLSAFARGLVSVELNDGGALHIVPGVVSRERGQAPDVMRGEETQILGLADETDADALCILPGTHSKWAVVRAGRIERFVTFMTGELFSVLRQHSILGRGMSAGRTEPSAFERGATAGLHEAGLMRQLFSVRTLGLFGELAEADAADYLSGLLIGAEIRSGLAWLEAGGISRAALLVGEEALCLRYATALRIAGVEARNGAPMAAANGLFRLARAAQLLDP